MLCSDWQRVSFKDIHVLQLPFNGAKFKSFALFGDVSLHVGQESEGCLLVHPLLYPHRPPSPLPDLYFRHDCYVNWPFIRQFIILCLQWNNTNVIDILLFKLYLMRVKRNVDDIYLTSCGRMSHCKAYVLNHLCAGMTPRLSSISLSPLIIWYNSSITCWSILLCTKVLVNLYH